MRILGCILLIALACPAMVVAQEKKKDNTGTNPINFTYDYRLYTEMQHFSNNAGSQVRGVMEFRAPLGRDMGNVLGKEAGRWQDLGNAVRNSFPGILQ